MSKDAIKRNIALVAHDNCKQALVEWVKQHHKILCRHHLICTGTTGRKVEQALKELLSAQGQDLEECQLELLKSGPLGGDLQLGARIAEGKIDVLIFLWDPMQAQPHDVDVKALLRISNLYNVATAQNITTASYLINSPLLLTAPCAGDKSELGFDFASYTERSLPS